MQRSLCYGLILLLGSPAVAIADAGCPPVLATVLGSESRPMFATWSFRDAAGPTFDPTHFLPASFLKELDTNFMEPKVVVKFDSGKQMNIRLAVKERKTKNERVVIHAALWADPEDESNLIVEKLRLQNPLADAMLDEGLSQRAKGLPLPVFKYARDQIFQLGRAGGFKRVKSASSSNYTVFMLYAKIVGLEPETPVVKETLDQLRALQKFAFDKLPEAYRVRAMEDFARIIGEAGVPLHSAHAQAWADHLAGKAAPSYFQLVKNDAGQVIGFINDFTDRPKEIPAVVFLDPKTGQPIDFGGMALSGRLSLIQPL